MSRLAKKPIQIPSGVEIKVGTNEVTVKGPKGSLKQPITPGISIKIEEGKAFIVKDAKATLPRPAQGLAYALLQNMILGVTKGFEKRLEMIGVGYRAAVQGQKLDLAIGKSHPTHVPIPQGMQVVVDKSVKIVITGCDKQAVGQFAATVRAKKPPEPYKGKGIRYENEYVRKKAGKAAKAKTAAG